MTRLNGSLTGQMAIKFRGCAGYKAEQVLKALYNAIQITYILTYKVQWNTATCGPDIIGLHRKVTALQG